MSKNVGCFKGIYWLTENCIKFLSHIFWGVNPVANMVAGLVNKVVDNITLADYATNSVIVGVPGVLSRGCCWQ